jgi:predicted metalloprotease
MQWEGGEESSNVEDRRGMGGKAAMAGGGVSIVAVIIYLLTGVNFQGGGQGIQGPEDQPAQVDNSPERQKEVKFVKVVLKYSEEVWGSEFKKHHKQYQDPKLEIFSGYVNTKCGGAESAVGPFYCPGDDQVYIDLTFFDEMSRKLNAPGEFARAYVITHEVGHHVQNLLGYSKRVRGANDRDGSVRLELQADYLAGVCLGLANRKHHFLESGDMDSAINAAFQIGDDTLTKRAGGRVIPEKFTHGSSAQRKKWFREGFEKPDGWYERMDYFFAVRSAQDL